MSRGVHRVVVPILTVPLLLAATVTVGWLGPPTADAAGGAIRYASPTGGPTGPCSKTHPCSLQTAINHASSGDEVIIKAGTYDKAAPLTTSLSDGGAKLDIEGAGAKSTVIYSAAPTAISLERSSLSQIQVRASGAAAGVVADSGVVDQVIVIESAAGSVACQANTSLTDSVCVDSGSHATAIVMQASAAGTPVQHLHTFFYGVTAEAPAATGIGLQLTVGGYTVDTLRVTNSILHGGKDDAVAATTAGTGTAILQLRHCDDKTTHATGATGAPSVQSDSTDIRAAPKFVAAGADNFAEKATSPTIDAGGTAPVDDPQDVLGNPRSIGRIADIGAYEFLQPPGIAGLTVSTVGKTTATLSVQVNPEGLATTVRVVATLGGKKVTGHAKAGSGHGTKTVHLHLTKLHRRALYKVQAIATNKGGSARTVKKSLHTGA